jgi:hypothetical protein
MLPETESNEVSSLKDCSSSVSLPIVEPWIASAAATLQVSYMQDHHLYFLYASLSFILSLKH